MFTTPVKSCLGPVGAFQRLRRAMALETSKKHFFLIRSHEPGRVRIKSSVSLSPGKHVPSLQHRAPFCPGLSHWKGPQKIPDPALSRSGGKTGSEEIWLMQGIQQVWEAWRAEAQSGREGVCNGWRQGFCDIWSGWGWGWGRKETAQLPLGGSPVLVVGLGVLRRGS